jgi:hypothetical protein
MKALTLGLIVTLAVLTCSAQQQEKRRPGFLTFFGPARSVRIERAQITSLNGESIEGPRILLAIINYDEDGTTQERTTFRSDGSILSKTKEAYDSGGRVLEISNFKGNGDPGSRIAYKYDGNSKLIEQTVYRPNGSIAHRTTFTYADDRRLHESVGYDENGVVDSRVTGSLDLKTHKIDTVNQFGNQVDVRQSGFTDTPQGQVFEERVNGAQTERTLNRSLGNGGREIIQYNPDGTVKNKSRFQTSLDSHGNAVKQIWLDLVGGSDNFTPVAVQYVTIEYYGKD